MRDAVIAGVLGGFDQGFEILRARYYGVHFARFITRDTFLGSEEDPLSLNRYSYVMQDPINNIDPSGHFAVTIGQGSNLNRNEWNQIQTRLRALGYRGQNNQLLQVTGGPNQHTAHARELTKQAALEADIRLVWNVSHIAAFSPILEATIMSASGSAGQGTENSRQDDDDEREHLTTLYRAVGPAEFYSIMSLRIFTLAPNMRVKQFGFNRNEVIRYADWQPDYAAVIGVDVVTETLNTIALFSGYIESNRVEKYIFSKSYIVVVHFPTFIDEAYDLYKDKLTVGMPLKMQIGNRIIGKAKLLEYEYYESYDIIDGKVVVKKDKVEI